MASMTPDEMERLLTSHERILNGDNGRFVRSDLYKRDLRTVEQDVAEIKDSIRWALRLVVTQFFVLVITLVIVFAQNPGASP